MWDSFGGKTRGIDPLLEPFLRHITWFHTPRRRRHRHRRRQRRHPRRRWNKRRLRSRGLRNKEGNEENQCVTGVNNQLTNIRQNQMEVQKASMLLLLLLISFRQMET